MVTATTVTLFLASLAGPLAALAPQDAPDPQETAMTDTGIQNAPEESPEAAPEERRAGWRKFLRRGSILATILLIFHILGAFSAFHAVMNTRTSQGAIAWTVSLVSVPWVAVPAYWVLGRSKFEGYVNAR